MRFRFHRGGLKESLETEVIVSTPEELKERLQHEFPGFKGEVEILPAGFDERLNREVWFVKGEYPSSSGQIVVLGMSDSKF